MNKSGRNKIKQRSAVSRKLLMQYVISIIGYVVGVMLFVFVAWRFCMMFIWQPDDLLYILLQTIFYKGIMPSETGFRFSSGL